MLPLLTTPGQLRRFLLVSAQSSIGTAMGYVALLLIAHEQLGSAWALAVVLTATLLPSAILGPYFGKLADRRPRRSLCVTADVLCAIAFAGIALSHSFAATAALTFAAGLGGAMFRPASRAAIPHLAGGRADEAAGAVVTVGSAGTLIGPALGAAILLIAPVQTLLLVNALTFAVSAYVLLGLQLDGPKPADKPWVPMTLEEALAEERFQRHAIREGFRAARTVPRLVLVSVASACATYSLAFANVGEPLLATGPLGGGDAAYSLIVAVFGVGATVGALLGRASVRRLVGSILAGAAVMACIAVAPTLAVALVCFAFGGLVDGISISCDQRISTTITPPEILGRVFGLKDSLDAIALLGAYVSGAFIAATWGPRWVFGASAILTAVIGLGALAAAARSRGQTTPPPAGPARLRQPEPAPTV